MNILIYFALFRTLRIPIFMIFLLSRFKEQEFLTLAVFVKAALSDPASAGK